MYSVIQNTRDIGKGYSGNLCSPVLSRRPDLQLKKKDGNCQRNLNLNAKFYIDMKEISFPLKLFRISNN